MLSKGSKESMLRSSLVGRQATTDGTGSVCGSTCWYLAALDQYKVVMVDP